jgi:hypothetical protein
VRVAGRGPAQDRDALAGNALLVSIKRLDSRIEEHEPRVVHGPRGRRKEKLPTKLEKN